MTKTTLELSEGDWIVHCRYGLGQIMGMDSKNLLGDRKAFYVVKTDAMTYWLPVSESGTKRIRPVASKETFEAALAVAAAEPRALEENFRRRLAYIQEQIQAASLLTKAALLRDMHARDVQKDIHINERKILETLKQQFVNERVAACGVDAEQAWTELRQALKKSSQNLKPKKKMF